MTGTSAHTIQQQKIHISFNGEIRPEELSTRLSSWIKEKLLPAIEMVLNELDVPGYRTRIDSLNINAGEVEGEDWERLLTEKICIILKQQIREASTIVIPVVTSEKFGEALTLYSDTEKHKLLLTYLSTGHLPWYAANIDVSTLMEWIEHLVFEKYFSSEEVKKYFGENISALHRFLIQVKPALLETWFNQWKTKQFENWLPGIIAIARKVFGQNKSALVFSYALLFLQDGSSTQSLWKQMLHERYMDSELLQELIELTEKFSRQQLSFEEWQHLASEAASALKEIGDTTYQHSKQNNAGEDEQQRDEYFIKNAGLVILHPFLKTFFTNLELLNNDGSWINIEAHKRSVLICNYVVTGSTEMAEYDLPLCKLITGYPFDEPVEIFLNVTDEEENETKALLRNVIEKWSILKTTSPEGLRNSFLIRDGKLHKQENGWLLQVHQKSFDILMDHLPWGIGVIKNNWMTDMLFTEWI